MVDDPDAPGGTYLHWVGYDLAPDRTGITGGAVPAGAREGDSTTAVAGWVAPCPPSGTHRYRFTVYAVSGHLQGGTADDLLGGLDRLTLARGTLTGTVAAR